MWNLQSLYPGTRLYYSLWVKTVLQVIQKSWLRYVNLSIHVYKWLMLCSFVILLCLLWLYQLKLKGTVNRGYLDIPGNTDREGKKKLSRLVLLLWKCTKSWLRFFCSTIYSSFWKISTGYDNINWQTNIPLFCRCGENMKNNSLSKWVPSQATWRFKLFHFDCYW